MSKLRRSKGEKPLREMLEHAVVCFEPVRDQCSDCLELRAALKEHVTRCTRAVGACSMPFCAQLRTNSNPFSAAKSLPRKQEDLSSSAASLKKPSVSLFVRAPPLPESPVGDEDEVHNKRRKTLEEDDENSAEEEEANDDASALTSRSVVMEGTFDGRLTFSGQWAHEIDNVVSDVKRPFGYVYREEDVNDPDGSLPCHACHKIQDNPTAVFVACDLCDHVFHLSCAHLDSVPTSSWFCPECISIRAKLIPSEAGPNIKLPPTRSWTGHFLMNDMKMNETLRLEFKWRDAPTHDGIIADVTGKGKNYFGAFSIQGQLSTPRPPRWTFPLRLVKTYDDTSSEAK